MSGLVGGSGGDRKFESVQTGLLNGAYIADTGPDIQTQIDAADSDLTAGRPREVHLKPGKTYTISSEINLKPNTILRFNGSRIEPDSDNNCIFMDQGSALVDAKIFTNGVSGYSSNAIEINTSRAGDSYRLFQDEEIYILGRTHLLGGDNEGTGLYMEADSANGGSILLGTRVNLNIRGFATAIEGKPLNTANINGNEFHVIIERAGTAILHSGDNNFASVFRGQIQPKSGVSNYGIRENSASTTGSVKFQGIIWDSGDFDNAPIDGDWITAELYQDSSGVANNSTLSKNTHVIGHGGQRTRFHGQNGTIAIDHAMGPQSNLDGGFEGTVGFSGNLLMKDGARSYWGNNQDMDMRWNDSDSTWRWTAPSPGNMMFYYDNHKVMRWLNGVTHSMPTLSSDPSDGNGFFDGECMIYVSDGSAGVTGDDGDVILAVNSGGTVKTTTLADFSAL